MTKKMADNALANASPSPSMQTNAVRHYFCLLKSGQKSYTNKHIDIVLMRTTKQHNVINSQCAPLSGGTAQHGVSKLCLSP